MEILVCVKRVPMVGGKIVVTADGQDVDTRMSGFTVSPHEECAVEEAVRLVERHGGHHDLATDHRDALDADQDLHRGQLLTRSFSGSNSGVEPATATVTGYRSPRYSTASARPASACSAGR